MDLDDNIVFERNTIKQVYEYAIDILEEIGKPTKIDKIYELLEHRNPGITKSVDALRGSLQRSPKIKPFSRSSTYGLEKWEKEKENIKAGSIKDLVLDYLDQKDDPIHINQILSEVKKQIGVPVLTDVHDQFQVEQVASVVDEISFRQ